MKSGNKFYLAINLFSKAKQHFAPAENLIALNLLCDQVFEL